MLSLIPGKGLQKIGQLTRNFSAFSGQSAAKNGDKRRRYAQAIAATMEALEHRVMLSVINWTGTTGNWNDPTQWSGQQIPGTGDVAIIPAGADVTMNTNVSVGTITAAGGSTVTLQTGMQLTEQVGTYNGVLDCDGLITGGGLLTLGGTTVMTGVIDGVPILNSGSLTLNDAEVYGGLGFTNSGFITITNGVALAGGVTLTNEPGASITVTDDYGLTPSTNAGAVNGEFVNEGTFTKSGGTGTSVAPSSLEFYNVNGTVNIDSGNFTIAGPALSRTGRFLSPPVRL